MRCRKVEGKIRSRKMLTLKKLTIGNFMYDVYLPMFKKYIYHIHYVHILSKNMCGILRNDCRYCKAGSIFTIRDYTERMSDNFNPDI